MRHIEQQVKKEGARAIRLDTFTQNPYAVSMYEGLGYAKRGYANWRKGSFYLMEKKLGE